MLDWGDQLLRLGAAIATGLLIGIERGWTLREAQDGFRVAGVRTFTLLGFLAGFTGLLAASGLPFAGQSLLAAAGATLVLGYVRSSRTTLDATPAIAGLVVLALGFICGFGNPALGIAGAAIATLVLALRREAHRLIGLLGEDDIKAGARYAVIAGAFLPFLPAGRYGPYDAWQPRELWLVVILVTGFSFAGYIANRVFGAHHGTIATAIIGGAYSSTAVTYSLSQRLGSERGGGAENAGIAVASTVMYLRVLVLVTILAPRIVVPFAGLILPAFLTGLLGSAWLWKNARRSDDAPAPGNPIALIPAITFALFVAVAAVAARWAEGQFGEQGIAILILIMGAMDVDTAIITLGGLDAGATSPQVASLALAGTVLANMLVKLAIALVYGRGFARPGAAALLISLLVLGASIAIVVARL